MRDVQRWLAEEPIASSSSADAQRIREAVVMSSAALVGSREGSQAKEAKRR